MKSANIRELKRELQERPPHEVLDLCLRLCRFKKENKELMTYVLFESHDEDSYIENVKQDIDDRFTRINRKSPYFVRKSFRSILLHVRKFIRYSSNKETEVELLLYFCEKMKGFRPDIRQSKRQLNLYLKLLEQIDKKIQGLHEDLRYDFQKELNSIQHRK